MATDYTPNVDDIAAPTSGHPPYRVFDEIRLVKTRLATVYASFIAINDSVAAAQLAQSLAELARDAAAASELASSTSEGAAAASALAASLSEAAASASESASADNLAFAELWATAPYGQEVITGSGLYSALHWATEAANIIAGGFIDDSLVATNRAYSSSKVMELHNAQAIAIANLASCSGSISNSSTPVFNPIPVVVTQLPFTVTQASSNPAVFTLNTTAGTIEFIRAGTYNFFSSVEFISTTTGTRLVTFQLVDAVTDTVLLSQAVTVDLGAGHTLTMPLNTLLSITASTTVKIMVFMNTPNGVAINNFSSILASSATGGGGGATGGGNDAVFYLNDIVITADYAIPVGKNAMTAGAITIADGVTVTVPNGSTWTVV